MEPSSNKPFIYGMILSCMVVMGILCILVLSGKISFGNREAQKEEKTGNTQQVSNGEKVKNPNMEIRKPDQIAADQSVITSYYKKLETGDLAGAYAMKKDRNKVSFETFKSWYANVKKAEVTTGLVLPNNTYDFMVNLEQGATLKEKYHVVMSVDGNLIETHSSEKIASEGGETHFELSKNGDINTLTLYVNGEKRVIDTGKASDYQDFVGVYITANNKYLSYVMTAWESSVQRIYDIDQKKMVHELFSPSLSGFTADGKHFYQCQGSGMMGGYVDIFTAPNFTAEARLQPYNSLITDCYGYDSTENTLKYGVSTDGFKTEKIFNYNFDTMRSRQL